MRSEGCRRSPASAQVNIPNTFLQQNVGYVHAWPLQEPDKYRKYLSQNCSRALRDGDKRAETVSVWGETERVQMARGTQGPQKS